MPGESSTTCGSSTPSGAISVKRLAQPAAVVVHGHQGHAGEQIGEGAAHEVPVLDDVGDAGRGAGIVFQHAKFAVLIANDIDPANMDVGPETNRESLHFRAVVRISRERDRRGLFHRG